MVHWMLGEVDLKHQDVSALFGLGVKKRGNQVLAEMIGRENIAL